MIFPAGIIKIFIKNDYGAIDAESGEIAHRIRFMSHTESGACRTVRSEESTGVGIVPQVFGMERTALSFR